MRRAGGVASASRFRRPGDRDRLAVCDQLLHQVGAGLEAQRLEEFAEETGEERRPDPRHRQ